MLSKIFLQPLYLPISTAAATAAAPAVFSSFSDWINNFFPIIVIGYSNAALLSFLQLLMQLAHFHPDARYNIASLI